MIDLALMNAALALSKVERVELIERLMESLAPGEKELSEELWNEAWADEAERRLDRLAAGGGATIPAEQVHDALLRRFKA